MLIHKDREVLLRRATASLVRIPISALARSGDDMDDDEDNIARMDRMDGSGGEGIFDTLPWEYLGGNDVYD